MNPTGWANPPEKGNPNGVGLKGCPKKFLLVFWVVGFAGLDGFVGLVGVRGKVLGLNPPVNWLGSGLTGFSGLTGLVGQLLGFPFPITQHATRAPAFPVVKLS